METTKFYIASRDGLNPSAIFIDESKLTIPEDEQEAEDARYAKPFTVTCKVKIDDETANRFMELSEKFKKEREKGIKECAKYCGITEEEMSQILVGYEHQFGVQMIPTIKKPK